MLVAKVARRHGAWRKSKENRNALTDLTCVDRGVRDRHKTRDEGNTRRGGYQYSHPRGIPRSAATLNLNGNELESVLYLQTLHHSQIIPRHAP